MRYSIQVFRAINSSLNRYPGEWVSMIVIAVVLTLIGWGICTGSLQSF